MANLSLCAIWLYQVVKLFDVRVPVEVSVFYMTNLSLCATWLYQMAKLFDVGCRGD
jgi:hypothetical protein